MIDPAAFLKLISDLSLYYAIAGLFLPAGSALVPVGVIAASGLFGVALAGKKNVLRLLPIAPLLCSLLFIRSMQDAVLIVPAAAYVFAAVWTGRFFTDHYTFVSFFKKSAVFLPVVLGVALLFNAAGAAKNALPFAVCYLVTGILLVRLLRQDEATRREPRFLLLNLLFPVLSILTALLFTSRTFLTAAGGVLKFFYDNMINPLIIGAAYLIFGVIYVFQRGLSLLVGKRAETAGAPPSAFVPEEAADGFSLPTGEGNPLVGKILVALGLVLFLLLMFLLLKRLLGERSAAVSNARDAGERGTAERMDGTLDLGALLRPKTNADAVRQVYRKFLSRARSAGTVIGISDTSAVIAKRAAEWFDPALLNELREIYILARYSAQPISREQARRAKSIYAELKKGARG